MSEVLEAVWMSAPACMAMGHLVLGIVKVRNEAGQVKFYIGLGHGVSASEDAKYIADHGAKLDPRWITEFLT